ncbi:MAG: sigma-54-dependent Fis family transcriptional regulator [Planctomycetaceae bacterium]|nr:MAG: sigma-54-dependent Fis family transcriptional regulator [Planctomycetaceae bacterium]
MARTRSNINALSHLLGDCDVPIFALDAQRRFVYGNAACFAWLQVEPRSLMGKRCDYHSGPPGDPEQRSLNGLCPPPEVFLGRDGRGQIAWPRRDDTWEHRPARFLSLGSAADDKACGVLVLVDGPETSPAAESPFRAASGEDRHATLRQVLSELGERFHLDQVIGQHPAIMRAREIIRLAVQTDSRTLVIGPPGSGREHVARAVHYGGGHRDAAPLAPLACNLLDAELLNQTIASFAASCAELQVEHPGTLLLLEVDRLSSDAQAALAGILSIRELDLRTVATARHSLIDLAAKDQFRRDLAFALSTLEIVLPPLSQRRDDIPLLAQYFLERENAIGGKQLSSFADQAVEHLLLHAWPGNLDELATCIATACRRASGPQVTVADLPEPLQLAARAASRPRKKAESIQLDLFLEEVERELFRRALHRSKGNKAKVARLLGITRSRAVRRLQHFKLSPDDPPPVPDQPG